MLYKYQITAMCDKDGKTLTWEEEAFDIHKASEQAKKQELLEGMRIVAIEELEE